MRNDADIQKDVMTEIKWRPSINSANIGVAVKNGVVTLAGTVENYAQKTAAEQAAKKVAGVRAIAEDIQIGVSPNYDKTDADIADAVLNALHWHSSVPDDKLHIKVENGIVTLEGQVDWDFQRQSAKNAITHLVGVRDIINLVNVKPKVKMSDVRSKITAALHRSATIDAGKIKIEVDDSTIRLRGVVRSFTEKEDAEEAAGCAPGVSKVESYLYVEPQLELSF